MRTSNTIRWLFCGLACAIALAQPADARRFFIPIPHFGFGGESIERVYDLPETAMFETNGEHYDVGFLSGGAHDGFVLYHGDRYRKLDDDQIRLLSIVLGVDPTTKYRADHAEENAAAAAEQAEDRAAKDKRIAAGTMIERREGEMSSDYAVRQAAFVAAHRSGSGGASSSSEAPAAASTAGSRGGGFGGAIVGLFALAILILGGRRLYKASFGLTKTITTSDEPDTDFAPDVSAFDRSVARRLAELQGQGAPAPTAPGSVPPPARGFGRKAA